MDPAPGSGPPAAITVVEAGRQINCNDKQTLTFIDEAMQRGDYIVFLAFDADGEAVGLISLGACGAV